MGRFRCVGGPMHGKIIVQDEPPIVIPHRSPEPASYVGETDDVSLTEEVTYTRRTLGRALDENRGHPIIRETVLAPCALRMPEVERLWKTLPPDSDTVDHFRWDGTRQVWKDTEERIEELEGEVERLTERLYVARSRLARIRGNARRIERICDGEV